MIPMLPGPVAEPSYSAERQFSEIDRKKKTEAIKEARQGLLGIESLIESSINDDPPRFSPTEAKDLRNRFSFMKEKLERVLDMLAEERDEFEQLCFHLRKLTDDAVASKRVAKEAQEKSTLWYTKAMKYRRIMENEGITIEEGD